jgi:(S)-mandelate dehydrogenase
MNPNRFLNIDDLRQLAQRRLPSFAFAYLDGCAEDERALHDNTGIFRHLALQAYALRDTSQRDYSTTLLGKRSAFPLAVAPTGFNGMLWPCADILLAQAARDHGIPFTLSTMSSASIEQVAQSVPDGRRWFQLYVLKDRSIARDLVARARSAGYDTLIVTTDCAHYGKRERESRHFRAPLKLGLPALLNVAAHPGWVARVVAPSRGLPGFGNLEPYLPPGEKGRGAQFIARQLDASLNWRDIEDLRSRWNGKLVIKGIQTAEDAQTAVQCGANGIVLTNHGGRQLDCSVHPLQVLRETREALGDETEILVDSGFRRGSHVIKALALGANGVLIGRPVLYGVAAGGLAGAQLALRILCEEVDRTAALLGACSYAELRSIQFKVQEALLNPDNPAKALDHAADFPAKRAVSA